MSEAKFSSPREAITVLHDDLMFGMREWVNKMGPSEPNFPYIVIFKDSFEVYTAKFIDRKDWSEQVKILNEQISALSASTFLENTNQVKPLIGIQPDGTFLPTTNACHELEGFALRLLLMKALGTYSVKFLLGPREPNPLDI